LYAKETEFSMYVLTQGRRNCQKNQHPIDRELEGEERAVEGNLRDEQLAWVGDEVGEELEGQKKCRQGQKM
jgi:hypothetical protein